MRIVRTLLACFVLLGLAASMQPAEAQILKRLKERAKAKVEENLGEKQDEAIDKAFDSVGDEEEEKAAEESAPAQTSSTPEPAAPAEEPAPAAEVAKLKPGEGAWANYDFVPGERPIYVDDFSADRIGNFPKRMEFRSGNMQIVEWNGQRWLSAEGGELFINLPEVLPERFTMEFDLAGSGNAATIEFGEDAPKYEKLINLGNYYARLRSGQVDAQGELRLDTSKEPVKIRISVDGGYLKLYANEHRALNVPNANMPRSNRIYMNLNGWDAENPRMIANVRIYAGGTPMYDALTAEGRFSTQGILFDTGSDVIKPESSPTLREIGDMLKQYEDLRLRIEGHTDSQGDDASNLSLSERRAAAVKAFLVSSYQIDPGRLESQGLGETAPVADNATPEGRQQNRRVELVKL
ncbi:MAG TPA: OmpA family protein [Rhodothermales bacterium]